MKGEETGVETKDSIENKEETGNLRSLMKAVWK
jgi:hypothetical protein